MLALFAASVSAFNLEEARRLQLLQFWKRWLKFAFIAVIVLNSGLGLYLFFKGPTQVSRTEVFSLLVHLFNLFAIPGIWFMSEVFKVLDSREAKRVALTAQVAALEARLATPPDGIQATAEEAAP